LKLIVIFAGNIWSIQYDEEYSDEYTRLFECWTDMEYLEEFIEEHQDLLDDPFWKGYSKESVILMIYKEASDFMQHLKTLYDNVCNGQLPDFDKEFHPLSRNSYEWKLERYKAYGKVIGNIAKSFLRLYAIKIESNVYVITGGGIKLTKTMNECTYLNNELHKLDIVRNWLKSFGVTEAQDL
jgi:hypothetical protein